MVPRPALDEASLRAANINPATGLATDYLNHYNEVATLIGMLTDAPELVAPILDWRPVGYAAHFRLTGFSGRDIVISAYDTASEEVIARFRTARRRVELAINDVQDLLVASPSNPGEAASYASGIFALIASAGAVINGEAGVGAVGPAKPAQADIDARFS